jgi:hypothetical protein
MEGLHLYLKREIGSNPSRYGCESDETGAMCEECESQDCDYCRMRQVQPS